MWITELRITRYSAAYAKFERRTKLVISKLQCNSKGVDCLHYITCCIYCIVGLSMAGVVQTDNLLLFYVAYNTHACYATK